MQRRSINVEENITMSAREQLIREISQIPDPLVTEVLNFLLFIKAKNQQDDSAESNSETQEKPSFLKFIDKINSEIIAEENTKLPTDFSKNLDHYLYGSPKE
jgi:hypothetical protein